MQESLTEFKTWPKVTKNNFTYFDINTNVTVFKDSPRAYKEWKPLIENYYQHPLATL